MNATDTLFAALRPKLHRYCARMTGSVIDGEDVVQEALVKALEAQPQAGVLANPEGWLFRIAHNAALDFLRRRARWATVEADEELEMIADPADAVAQRQAAAASLRIFMRLPASQRSAVILRDVLGHSLEEVQVVTGGTIPAIKGFLQRGRERLRQLAQEPEDAPPPVLEPAERARLTGYVERFNARDFDALRAMLADDVRLDLVNRGRPVRGRADVGEYFRRYGEHPNWRLAPGFVDRVPALLAYDGAAADPTYFVLLGWAGDRLAAIRDFHFAAYAMEGAEVLPFGGST